MKSLNRNQRVRSRRLRHEQTEAERKLWSHLRDRQLLGAKFRRQLALGPFVVDFCCLEIGLIIELDGGQHVGRQGEDSKRSEELEARGFCMLRFWDDDVLRDTDVVLERIHATIQGLREQGRHYGG